MSSIETIRLRSSVLDDLQPSQRWPDTETSHQLGRLTVAMHDVATREYPDYRAQAGTAMLAEDGKDKATLSFIAYSKQTRDAHRPVTLVMNGGPLSPATLWNQNELFSPQVIRHRLDGHVDVAAPPQPNDASLLQESDIVFLDPAGTGYGDYLSQEKSGRLFGVDNDALCALTFLETFLRSHNQNDAPIILAGSSYATWRMTAMANMLQQKGRDASALLLISGGYDYSLITPDSDTPENNYLTAVTNVPNFAVTALYHGITRSKLSPERYYDQAAQFAWGPYAKSLINQKPSRAIVDQLAAYTGLDTTLIQEHNQVISPDVFQKQLLGARGLIVSGVDSRLAFGDTQPVNIDPALDNWESFYKTRTIDRFSALGYDARDAPYAGILMAHPQWTFPDMWRGRNAKAAMRRLLNHSPDLRIAEVSGLYDLLGNHQKKELFWQELLPECQPWQKETMAIGDHTTPQVQTISTYEVPAGHQPGIDPRTQDSVGKLACRLAASVSCDRTR
jgi:carboxypeptidase C (cathepsin A)